MGWYPFPSQLGTAHWQSVPVARQFHVHRGLVHQFPDHIELGVVLVPNQVEDNALAGGDHTARLAQAIQGQVPILVQSGGAAVRHYVNVDVLLQEIDGGLLHANVGLKRRDI